MKNTKYARGLSLLLCTAMLAGQMGMTVYAEEKSSSNRGGGCYANTTRNIRKNAAMWRQSRAIAVNMSTWTNVTRTN